MEGKFSRGLNDGIARLQVDNAGLEQGDQGVRCEVHYAAGSANQCRRPRDRRERSDD